MFNEAQVSVTGYVATQPRWRGRETGHPNLTMRVAWTPRRLDRSTGEWVDGHTSYVSVCCWRKLAENAATCLRKGDPVVVSGRLSVRDYTSREGALRTAVEIEAMAVGHDLSRGVAQFLRTRPVTGKTADELAAEQDDQTGQDNPAGLSDRAVPAGAADPADSAEPAGAAEPWTVTGDGGGTAAAVPADMATADHIFDEAAIAALAENEQSVPEPV